MKQDSIAQRALFTWPRLDPRKLATCGDDPAKIARLVAQRTRLPTEVIMNILLRSDRPDDEPSFYYFG